MSCYLHYVVRSLERNETSGWETPNIHLEWYDLDGTAIGLTGAVVQSGTLLVRSL